MWPDRRLLELFRIELPIVQAPVAGAMDWELAAAAAETGALGSLPCAMLNADQVREQMRRIRAHTKKAFGVAINPHLFRDSAATTMAIADPKHVRATAPLLGHRSFSTTERNYVQAKGFEAQRRFQTAMFGMRPRKGKR